jgi:hypothetical protein
MQQQDHRFGKDAAADLSRYKEPAFRGQKRIAWPIIGQRVSMRNDQRTQRYYCRTRALQLLGVNFSIRP